MHDKDRGYFFQTTRMVGAIPKRVRGQKVRTLLLLSSVLIGEPPINRYSPVPGRFRVKIGFCMNRFSPEHVEMVEW
jgi:hypothetical protein